MAPLNTTSLTAVTAPIGLTNGGPKGPTSYAGWSATQVIASASGGYEVLWSHTGGKYDVWKVDASGNFVSNIKAKLWEDEVKFGVDLNGDGDTGLVSVEAIGSVHLKHGDNTYNGAPQYYIVDGSDCPYWFNKRRAKGFNLLCWLECYPSYCKRERRL